MAFTDRLYRQPSTLADEIERKRQLLMGNMDAQGGIWEAPREPLGADLLRRLHGGAQGGMQNAALVQQPQQPMPAPTGQILTPLNQAAITRPRTVTEQPPPEPMPTRERSTNPFLNRLLTEPQYSQTRDRRTQPRDVVADDMQYLRDLEQQPLGKLDKVEKVIQTLRGLGGRPYTTRRERKLGEVESSIGRELTVQGNQYKQQALQSQIDAREAAAAARDTANDLRARGLDQQATAMEQRARNQKRAELIRQHAALTDFDPDDPAVADFVAAWENEFKFRPSKNVRGSQLQYRQGYDANGNVVAEVVHKGTGQTDQITGSKITSTEGQQTRGQRERLFNKAETGRNARSAAAQAGADRRSTGKGEGVKVDRVSQRQAAKLISVIEDNRKKMADADDLLKANPKNSVAKEKRRQAQLEGEKAATELHNLNTGYEAGGGTGGYPYYKKVEGQPVQTPTGRYAGRRISKAKVPEFAKRHNMTPDEAAKFLADEGAIIY